MTTRHQTVTARSARPAKAELIARVQALLPDVSPDSPRFQTALLYLTSRWTPNIDRLAAFASCDREFVAVRARRWADHGLWVAEPSVEGGLNRHRFLHAIMIGEALVPHSTMAPREETLPLFPPEQESATPSDWHTNEVAPNADAPDDPHGSRSTVAAVDGDPVSEQDSDTLLTDLWTRLGLSVARAVPERQAA